MARNNQVTLIGNLGQDARVYENTRGEPFVILDIGTTDSYLDEKTNQWKKLETVWHSIFAFSPTVRGYAANFKKGDRVKIQGSISYQKEKKTIAGEDHYFESTSIIARHIEPAMLPRKNLMASPQPPQANGTDTTSGQSVPF